MPMPEGSGIGKIGYLLFGGTDQLRAEAEQEARLHTAKTEDAFAQARLRQMEAQVAAEKRAARARTEENAIKMGVPAVEAKMLGDFVVGESGADFYAAQQGLRENDKRGYMATVADPMAPELHRKRAGDALKGEVTPNIRPVGTHGTTDLTMDDQVLDPSTGRKTTAISNFEYGQALPPEQRGAFAPYVRADQMIDTTAPRAARNPITGATQTVVSADDAAAASAAVTGADATAKEVVKLRKEYPQTKLTLGRMFQDINAQDAQIAEIGKQRALWQSFGLGQKIASIPGTDGANIRALVETLQSQLMLNTLISLRAMSKTGGAVGNVSDREGYKMETARANLSNPDITVGQVLSELDKLAAYNNTLRGLMQTAFEETYDEKGEPRLAQTLPRAGGAAPGAEGEVPMEGSIADAVIANGDGELNDAGYVVDSRGWILLESPDGAAWVNPENQNEFEEVAF